MAHLTFKELNKRISEAEKKVKPGDIYYHYKDRTHEYQIQSLCIIESTEEVGVLYKPIFDKSAKAVWMRPISNFLERVEVEGKKVKRFSKL